MLRQKIIEHAPKYISSFKEVVESLEIVGGKAGTLGVTLNYKFKDTVVEFEYNYFDRKEWKVYNVVENIIDTVSEITDLPYLNSVLEDDTISELDRYESHEEFMLNTSVGRIIIEEFPDSPEVKLAVQVAEKLENSIPPEDQQKLIKEFHVNSARTKIIKNIESIIKKLGDAEWSKEDLFQAFEAEFIKKIHEE